MSKLLMPFDTMGFYMATAHLTLEQKGAYHLLLMALWDADGRLPNDPKILARILRIDIRKWRFISAEVLPFFVVDGEHLTHKWITKELALRKRARSAWRAG